MRPGATQHHSVWRAPVAIGLVTLVGLLAALFDDEGPLDMFSWAALACPVLVCVILGVFAGRARSR